MHIAALLEYLIRVSQSFICPLILYLLVKYSNCILICNRKYMLSCLYLGRLHFKDLRIIGKVNMNARKIIKA